jgi:hypothetical protein
VHTKPSTIERGAALRHKYLLWVIRSRLNGPARVAIQCPLRPKAAEIARRCEMSRWANKRPMYLYHFVGAAEQRRRDIDAEYLGGLSGVSNRMLNYREFSFGPNCAFRFNFQRVVQRGQASYVGIVMAPSDFAQL